MVTGIKIIIDDLEIIKKYLFIKLLYIIDK